MSEHASCTTLVWKTKNQPSSLAKCKINYFMLADLPNVSMGPLNKLQYTVARQQIHLETFLTGTSESKYTNPFDTQTELEDVARWIWTTSVNLG